MTVKALIKAGDLELRIKEQTAGEQEQIAGPFISVWSIHFSLVNSCSHVRSRVDSTSIGRVHGLASAAC